MGAFDALLFRGDADPRTRSVLAAAYVLERTPSREALVAAFDRASRAIVRLRQHVVAPPWPILLPAWIVDPDFDLARHLRFERLPARASLPRLLAAIERQMAEPLDASRPLWDAVLYEGLPRGRAGLLFRMSHAIADGIGVVRLFGALFDTEAAPARRAPVAAPIPEDITPDELQREQVARLPAALLDAAGEATLAVTRAALRVALDPAREAARARDYLQSMGRIFATPTAPSPLLAGRSLARRLIALEVPLEPLKAAGRAAGGSLNDAYLAAVAGALGRYHEALGASVDAMPMAIPVNLRRDDDPAEGNFFGAVTIAAPLGIGDPAERIAVMHQQVTSGRHEPAIGAPALLAPALARLPERARIALAESIPRPDIQVSNVPGSPVPIFVAGGRVERAWAFGPVPGAAAMVTLQSIAGTCHVGVNLDPAAFEDPARFAVLLAAGFEEVLALSGTQVQVARPVMAPTARRRA